MKLSILVLLPVYNRHRERFQAQAPGAEFIYSSAEEVSVQQVMGADIIVGNPPPDMVKRSDKLRLLQLETAETNPYLPKGILPGGAVLTNSTGAYGPAVSEHMLAMTLMLMKRLHIYRDNQKSGLWRDGGTVKSICNSTVLVVGMGDIGTEFAKRMKAMGAKNIGVRRTGSATPEYFEELHLMEDLEGLLPRADIVALCLPETPETCGLISAKRLLLMRDDALLLNVGRGCAVDTDALVETLESGHLLGAGLDVTDPEPLPANHRLWKIPNVLITPHVSGGHHLPETFERIVDIAAYNLEAFVKGEPMMNVVDLSTGYRKLAE